MVHDVAAVSAATSTLWSVLAGVVTAAVIAMYRWVRKTAKGLLDVVELIRGFGTEWHEAVSLAQTIKAGQQDMAELKAQLGTEGRDPAWASVEAYLHQMHHQQGNEAQSMRLAAEALGTLSEHMSETRDEVHDLTAKVDALMAREAS